MIINQQEEDIRTSRSKAIEMLPELRKRDEGGTIVRINPRTWIIKKKKNENNED